MTKTFLPDWHYLSIGGHYRPLWKLFKGEDWRQLFCKGKPVLCGSAQEAMDRAEAHVERILNPAIRAERIETAHADILGIEEWRQKKAQEAEEEREKVFGAVVAKGRVIPVERKRRRA